MDAAPVFRRVLGWLVDYLVVMIPGLAVVLLAMAYLVQGLPTYVGGVAAEVGWGYLFGLVTHTGGASSSGSWVSYAMPLIAALLFVPLLQFGYQATLLAWRGRTFGKMVADTRVAGSGQARLARGPALRRAFATTTLETGLVGVALVLITIGQLLLGILLWGGAIALFWLSAFAAIGPHRRTLIDRLSGTVVVRAGSYAELAGKTSGAAITAGRKGSELAIAAGQATADAAFVTGQLAHESANAIKQSAAAQQAAQVARDTTQAIKHSTAAQQAAQVARDTTQAIKHSTAAQQAAQVARDTTQAIKQSGTVQQALNSRAGQQAQALGAAGTEQARKLGGRAKELWRQRRAKDTDQ